MKRDEERSAWSTCICGKRGFVSRHGARQHAKQVHPEARDLAAYRCLKNPKAWHYGSKNNREYYRRSA